MRRISNLLAKSQISESEFATLDETFANLQVQINSKADLSSLSAKKTDIVLAPSLILGRKTAGMGEIEELSLSEIMDFIGSAAAGDILFRGASGWVRLPKQNDGDILSLVTGLPGWVAPAGSGVTPLGVDVSTFTTTTIGNDVDITGASLEVSANKTYLVIAKGSVNGSSNNIDTADTVNLKIYIPSIGTSTYLHKSGYYFTPAGAVTYTNSAIQAGSSNTTVVIATTSQRTSNSACQGSYYCAIGFVKVGSTGGLIKLQVNNDNASGLAYCSVNYPALFALAIP